MIRSAYPKEVFSRYSTSKSESILQLYDHLLTSHRWSSSVLAVGEEQQSLLAFKEYFSDALITSLTLIRTPTGDDRIRNVSEELSSFCSSGLKSFNVVIYVNWIGDQSVNVNRLKTVLKDYGLLVVDRWDGVELDGMRVEGNSLYYWRV